ncbi:MAG TPA: hypothetical protein VIF57_20165 [Polyangia bacterium]|jgi:hypothetical protein
MQHDKKPVPDWLLERLALGELDAETAADVRRRLAAEGRSVDEMMGAVATSNREILAELPASQAAAGIRQRAARAAAAAERPARRRTVLWGLPVALAGGLALTHMMLRPAHHDEGVVSSTENPEIIFDKGSHERKPPRLYVYRHRAGADQQLTDGARAFRGDLVQLAYGSHEGGYGVVLSIDGRGKATVHWPEREGGAAPALDASGEIRLPSSYELDDAPAFERFFLVRAATPFSVATAMEAARALAAQPSARKQLLALPAGFEQISLALDKTHGSQNGTHAGQKEQP